MKLRNDPKFLEIHSGIWEELSREVLAQVEEGDGG